VYLNVPGKNETVTLKWETILIPHFIVPPYSFIWEKLTGKHIKWRE